MNSYDASVGECAIHFVLRIPYFIVVCSSKDLQYNVIYAFFPYK